MRYFVDIMSLNNFEYYISLKDRYNFNDIIDWKIVPKDVTVAARFTVEYVIMLWVCNQMNDDHLLYENLLIETFKQS